MVTEDYSPFLINVIYLQDLGLLSYPHHRPLERMNWASPVWADTRGQAALLGLPLFWGPVDGRLFSNPITFFFSYIYLLNYKIVIICFHIDSNSILPYVSF